MAKIKFIIPALFILILASCQTEEKKAPQEKKGDGTPPAFSFIKTAHDFGTLVEGEVAEFTFVFTNTGGSPLIISSAKASCGCTATDYTKSPVAPGEQGSVKLSFDSAGFRNNQHKSVVLTANTAEKTAKVSIGAFVETKIELQENL